MNIKIKKLKAPIRYTPRTPRCQHVVSDVTLEHYNGIKKHNKDYMIDARCKRKSSVQINDKNYCLSHAGMVAISILLEENGEEMLR